MRLLAVCALAALISLSSQQAQAQAMRPDVRAAMGPSGTLVRLVTSFGKKANAKLYIGGAKTLLHKGETAGTVASGHGRVVVAVSVDRAVDPFVIYAIDGKKLGKPMAVARPRKSRDIPFAVAATPTPDGFSVFFQEIQNDNTNTAHTYLVKLDKTGVPQGAAQKIAVPWSLGAAAWNGNGYHLALLYPGGSTGMRLSMVSLTPAGRPEQHPDWASAAGYIADVHLVPAGGKIRAFYRGGKSGNRLLESDVTKIGQWGREPAKAKSHGALAPHKAIAISKHGKPKKVTGARL